MSVWLVSRYPSTHRYARLALELGLWPAAVGRIDHFTEVLDVEAVQPGDLVIGTLPMAVAAKVVAKGARFMGLDIDLPPGHRAGQELSATELASLKAHLTEYTVEVRQSREIHAVAATVTATKPAVTIMLVSDQLAPQAIGWRHRPMPCVALWVSPRMQGSAKILAQWFKAHHAEVKVGQVMLSGGRHAQLKADIPRQLQCLLEAGHEKLVINLTGGTKLMTTTVQEAIGALAPDQRARVDTYYVDTQNHDIACLRGPTAAESSQPMQTVLNVRDLLELNGFQIKSAASAGPDFRRQVAQREVHELLLSTDALVLGALNFALMQMERALQDRRVSQDVRLERVADGAAFRFADSDAVRAERLSALLSGPLGDLLVPAGVLTRSPVIKGTVIELRFAGQIGLSLYPFSHKTNAALDYLKGGWLEAYAAQCLLDASADKVLDWAAGVQVTHPGPDGKTSANELDLVATCGNKSLLIEAKTGNQTAAGQGDAGDTRATETLYKFDSLGSRVARSFGERWLVTFRPPNDGDLNRARDMGIRVFANGVGDKNLRMSPLRSLTDKMRQWLESNALRAGLEFQRARFEIPEVRKCRQNLHVPAAERKQPAGKRRGDGKQQGSKPKQASGRGRNTRQTGTPKPVEARNAATGAAFRKAGVVKPEPIQTARSPSGTGPVSRVGRGDKSF